MKTAVDLAALARQKTWDKDVVLWVGAEHALLHILGQTPYEVLDLLDLFDEESLPMDEEETRVQLLRRLRHKLQSFQVSSERRTVLVVKSIGLLARYYAGVREFYEWFCGDFTMVVLLLDGLLDEHAWPEEVACDADRLLKYFHKPGVVKEVFGEGRPANGRPPPTQSRGRKGNLWVCAHSTGS